MLLAPSQVASEFSKKTQIEQAEQDHNLPRLASNVLRQSPREVTPLCLREWRGKWKWQRGK